jgi:hypothetical protein
MRRLALAGLSLLLAACSTSAPTGSPAPSGSPGPSGSPSASPAPEQVIIRAWTTQALPPPAQFTTGASVAIADGKVIVPGAMILIYPGPLLPPLVERPISQIGISRILEAAQAAGLLQGPEDLTGGIPPGGITGHILFVLGGQEREVIGDPGKQIMCITTPCVPPAGTPEAFGSYWAQLSNPASLAGESELGPEGPYVPTRVAVLVTDPPADDPGLEPGIAQWPLITPIREFGAQLGTDRCGLVEGAELPAFLTAAGQANQLTRWTDGTTGDRVLIVRPLLPGEPDPCR